MSIESVDPLYLRNALMLFYDWAESGSEDQNVEMHKVDLHEFLDKLSAELKTTSGDTIALFQRVIALSAYCMREDVPEDLFDEDGLPGPRLCGAAARGRIVDLPEDHEGQVTHRLDGEVMKQLLRDSSN